MLEGIIFFFLWISFLLVWRRLLVASKIRLTKISIPSVLAISLLAFQYVGIPFLFFGLDAYRLNEISDKTIIIEIFALSSLVITLTIIGFFFSAKLFGTDFSSLKLSRYYEDVYFPPRVEVIFSCFLLAVGMVALYQYISVIGVDNIALFAAVSSVGSESSSVVLRSQMGNAFEGRYYLYKFLMRDVLIVASCSLFVNWLVRRAKYVFFMFILSVIACAVSLLLATEKGPFATYLGSLASCYWLAKARGWYSVKVIILPLAALVGIISAMYMFFMGAETPFEGGLQGASRLFAGQIQPLYHYLEIFPSKVDFLYGSSFPNPGGVFPFKHYQLTVEVMNIVQPWHLTKGVVGTMPTFYWGELYANFGYVGVFIFPVFVGMSVCYFADRLDKLRPTPFVVSVVVWFAFHIKNLATTSISNYLFDMYIFFILIILFFGLLAIWKGKIFYRNRFLSHYS